MKLFGKVFGAWWAAILFPIVAIGGESASTPPPMNCDIGPVNKTYGKTEWFVYSCSDGRTVVLVSAPGNPAMPFVFMFHPREDGYQLHGEGAGKKEATAATFNDLKTLSERDIKALIEQTKVQKKQ
jgi:hypothetical protein